MMYNMNSKLRVLLLGALTGIYLGLTACTTTVAHDGYYYHPSHTGYDYYYYPSVDIYLDISGGYYWYRDHDHWTRVRRLPAHLHAHDHERVFLRLDTDRPYTYHQQHRKRYMTAPQRRDDRHGSDQRREYAPGAKQDRAQVRDSRRPGPASRPARPATRQTPPGPRRAVQQAQRESQPRPAADTNRGRDIGKAAAPEGRTPPPVSRGTGRESPSAQAIERKSDAGASPQRRNNRGPGRRPDPQQSREATRDKPPRQVTGKDQGRRERPRGDDRQGPQRGSEGITDDAASDRGPRRPARSEI